MARFSVILSIAVVAVIALYTNQVLAQNSVIAADEMYNPNNCSQIDASDCKGKPTALGCKGNLCCSGLKYAAAASADGSVEVFNNGTCTCCAQEHCLILQSSSQGSTPNSQSNAEALERKCDRPSI